MRPAAGLGLCHSYAQDGPAAADGIRLNLGVSYINGSETKWLQMDVQESKRYEKGILSTGFPLEFQVAKMFQRHGWSTISSRYYVDDVQGIARELDIVAYKVAVLKDVEVCTAVLISCKRSEHDSWALIAQDKKERDPNTQWYPLHAWTNQRVLRYWLNETKWQPDYVGAARQHAFFKGVMYPAHHIFAFQLLNKKSGKAQDSRKIFDTVSSLMKAQGYEIETREKSQDSKRKRIFDFNLLSVADAQMKLCRLEESDSKDVNVSLDDTDREAYIASYIINQQEVVARVNFVTYKALDLTVTWLDEKAEFNVHYFEEKIDEFYANPFASEERAEVFKKDFESRVLHWIRYGLPKGRDKEKLDGLSFWQKAEDEPLRIGLSLWESGNVDVLNEHKEVKRRVADALAHIYRYTGPFLFDEDIPF